MVNKPNRKGWGIKNPFTRKVTPTINWVTGKRANDERENCKKNAKLRPFLRDETFMEGFERSLIFLYYKMKGQAIPSDKKYLTKDERNELKFAMQGFKGSFEEMSEQIFHENLISLNEELSFYEQHLPDRILNKGTEFQRCAFPVSTYLDRLFSLIIKSDRQLQYAADYSDTACALKNNKAVTRLNNSDACISLASSYSDLEEYPEEYRAKSYIIVDPEYMPVESTTPITIKANRLLSLSFIMDAFKNDGIQQIEPILLETLKIEAPELFELKEKDPVILITPRYIANAQATKDRFMVVDPSGLPRGRNVRNAVNFKTSQDELIRNLFQTKQVYLVDPLTSTELRIHSPDLWLSNFNDPNIATLSGLSENEQLTISFLQYIEALRRFSASRANTTQAIQNASEIYSEDLTSTPIALALFENLQDKLSFEWNKLVELQIRMTGTAEIRNPQDLVILLRKFNRSFLSKNLKGSFNKAYSYNTRKNRVKAMLSPSSLY